MEIESYDFLKLKSFEHVTALFTKIADFICLHGETIKAISGAEMDNAGYFEYDMIVDNTYMKYTYDGTSIFEVYVSGNNSMGLQIVECWLQWHPVLDAKQYIFSLLPPKEGIWKGLVIKTVLWKWQQDSEDCEGEWLQENAKANIEKMLQTIEAKITVPLTSSTVSKQVIGVLNN